MVQAGDRVRLALEALAEGRQTFLDGNDAIEAGIERLVNLPHAADANGRDDFVGTEPGTGGKEHRGRGNHTLWSESFPVKRRRGSEQQRLNAAFYANPFPAAWSTRS